MKDSSDLLSLATLGSVKLAVSSRCINNCGAFRWPVKFGLCGVIFREKISIVIHRNIRFLLALIVNVEVPVSYQLSTRSGSGPGIGNAMMNDFTPRVKGQPWAAASRISSLRIKISARFLG
jgi:hypothetical protein